MLFQKNFTTKNGIWLNLSAIYKFKYYKTYFEHGISKLSFWERFF